MVVAASFLILPSLIKSEIDKLRGYPLDNPIGFPAFNSNNLLGLDLTLDDGGRKSVDWYVAMEDGVPILFLVLSSASALGINQMYTTLDKSEVCPTVLQEGPYSPASTSHSRFFLILGMKYLSQALFMFPMVISSSLSNGTNSRGPIRVYFWALPETSADSRCTVSSSPLGCCFWSFGAFFFYSFGLNFLV